MTLDEVLYPDIDPFETGYLSVDEIHTLSWEKSGNPNGVPVVVLHGGPGAGRAIVQRRMFDPDFYQIILFDQRGCGKSTPRAELKNNTTQHLISDLEALRTHFKFDRWLVCGGSWGSFLSLVYSQAHPDSCLGLRLSGVSVGSDRDAKWRYGEDGLRRVFPEAWEDFRDFIPESERSGDLMVAYYRRLINPDPAIHLPAGVASRRYSAITNSMMYDPEWIERLVTPPEKALATQRISLHYKVNDRFMPPGSVMANVGAVRHLPGIIVQGRFDMITPVENAYELSKAWPEVEYRIVAGANHAPNNNPEFCQALVEAHDWLKGKITG